MPARSLRLRRTVANDLRRMRRERGWTQEELAGRAGLNSNYVGMVEPRENAATVDTLERLANALGIEAAARMPPRAGGLILVMPNCRIPLPCQRAPGHPAGDQGR